MRKKGLARFLSMTLAVALTMGVSGQQTLVSAAGTEPKPVVTENKNFAMLGASGLTANLADGVLTIEGSGTLEKADLAGYESEKANIKKVAIGKGITEIGGNAFAHYEALERVSLPESVTTIGGWAFYGCVSLEEVSVEAGSQLTEIGEFAFDRTVWQGKPGYVLLNNILVRYNGNDKTLTVPGSVSQIAYRAFKDCTALESLVIEDGVQSIKRGAFFNDTKLSDITVPKSVTEIAPRAIGYVGSGNEEQKAEQPPTIRCYWNTAAHKYALANDIPCTLLDAAPSGLKVKSITLSDTQCTIEKGQTRQLQATVFPANADNKEIEWTSDDPTIAVVNSSGVVIALKEGLTRIRATSKDGSAVSVSCAVKVVLDAGISTSLANGVLTIEGSGIVGPADLYRYEPYKANITSIVIREGVKEIEDYTFRDYTALESVNISSGVERIGYHAIGYIRDIYVGTDIVMQYPPIIYCYRNSAAYQYAVTNGIPYRLWNGTVDTWVTGISLDRTSATMQSQSVMTLNAVVTPWNATNKELRWSSSNSGVATVNNYGEVVARSAGTAVITASSTDGSGVSASCVVTVWSRETFPVRAEQVVLDRTAASLETGQSMWLQASVYPVAAANRSLNWTSNNPSVAVVSAYGLVTAVSAGTAVITATSTDGSGGGASCIVTVYGRTWNPTPRPTTVAPVAPDRGLNALYYVIRFDANGGTHLSRDSMTLLENDRMGILPTAQRQGYEFAGWYTMPSGGEHVVSDTIMNKAATLYAHWDRVSIPDPEKVRGLSLGTRKQGVLEISFDRVDEADGYQVVYSADKNFKASETKRVSTGSTKGALKNLKKGKTYYVKVRAYGTDVDGSRIYGPYSVVKKAKVK